MHPKLTLEKRIEAEIKSFDGLMGVYANDMKGNQIVIHGKEIFETASTIKSYILVALMDAVKFGNKNLDEELIYQKHHFVEGSGILRSLEIGLKLRARDVATLMIIVSDNIATNMMIEYLGIDEINQTIVKYGWESTKLHNHLDFEKYSNLGSTTVEDYGDLFLRLSQKNLIGEKEDQWMISIFKEQHYNSSLIGDFPVFFMDSEDTGEEELFQVASKSGSMDACRNDGGIIYTPYGPYILVLFTKDFSDSLYYDNHPSISFSAKVSRMIFDQFLGLEGRFVL